MMMRAYFLGIVASVLGLSAVGCGGPGCPELCTEREACPDVQPSSMSCADQCIARDKLVAVATCQTQQQVYDACLVDLPDACNAATECSTEAKAINACTNNYCKANPDKPECPKEP